LTFVPSGLAQGFDMTDQSAQEPTMEEILASIRRIISEDDAPAETARPQRPEATPEPEPEPSASPKPSSPPRSRDPVAGTRRRPKRTCWN
jgi:cell pole-organizing protein PopZ